MEKNIKALVFVGGIALLSLVEENEKYRVEHVNPDIRFDQRSHAVNGFSKVDGLGVEVHFLDLSVESHHGRWASEKIGNPASGISLAF